MLGQREQVVINLSKHVHPGCVLGIGLLDCVWALRVVIASVWHCIAQRIHRGLDCMRRVERLLKQAFFACAVQMNGRFRHWLISHGAKSIGTKMSWTIVAVKKQNRKTNSTSS